MFFGGEKLANGLEENQTGGRSLSGVSCSKVLRRANGNACYLDHAAEQAELIRSVEKNLPLYRLTLFSAGIPAWRAVLEGSAKVRYPTNRIRLLDMAQLAPPSNGPRQRGTHLRAAPKISPGCKHCYAERMSLRLQAMGQPNYSNGLCAGPTRTTCSTLPLRWNKPTSGLRELDERPFPGRCPARLHQKSFRRDDGSTLSINSRF